MTPIPSQTGLEWTPRGPKEWTAFLQDPDPKYLSDQIGALVWGDADRAEPHLRASLELGWAA